MAIGSVGGSFSSSAATPHLRAFSAAVPKPVPAQSLKGAKNDKASQNDAASLEGQIRVAREQLNDWVTCVSATTPKGQAEIRSLSGQISAAQDRINRLAQTSSDTTTASSAGDASASAPGALIDLWA